MQITLVIKIILRFTYRNQLSKFERFCQALAATVTAIYTYSYSEPERHVSLTLFTFVQIDIPYSNDLYNYCQLE